MFKWIRKIRRKSSYDVDRPTMRRERRSSSFSAECLDVLGERLMCVWQAVYVFKSSHKDFPRVTTLCTLTDKFASSKYITFDEDAFKERVFTETMKYEDYMGYLFDVSRVPDTPVHLLVQDLENMCWDLCVLQLRSQYLEDKADMKKLWVVYNKLSIVGSYPPVMDRTECNWLLEQMVHLLGVTVEPEDFLVSESVRFVSLLFILDTNLFALATPEQIHEGVNMLYTWLGREVIKTGSLLKRVKKKANWSSWQRCWFVLTPTSLSYYNEDEDDQSKGELLMQDEPVVSCMPDYSGYNKKLSYRFKIEVKSIRLKLELCADTLHRKLQWMSSIEKCSSAMSEGTSPVMKLLQQRHRFVKEKSENLAVCDKEIRKTLVMHRFACDDPIGIQRKASTSSTVSVESDMKTVDQYETENLTVEDDKLKVLFFQMDKDGNGQVDQEEFYNFIQELGLNMERRESDLVFLTVDKDNNGFLSFQEFKEYFLTFIFGEGCSTFEAKLRSAFLAADKDGSGRLDFGEFAEHCWSRRRTIAMGRLATAFNKLDIDQSGDICFKEFRMFFNRKSSDMTLPLVNDMDQAESGLEELFRNVYEKAEAEELASFLCKRWKIFQTFRRKGASGGMVMKGGHGIVGDQMPGEYELLELACFNDLPAIVPQHTVINGIEWQSSEGNLSGRLVLPQSFDGKIATDLATNETLAYYDCSLAEGNQQKVSLLYRHGIQDFTYENNYLDNYVLAKGAMGGAGVEKHAFAHLDCPLDANSGLFVIAKIVEDDMYITAFKIPTRHTLYVPPYTIHSNDYLRGTWRTMLSDEAAIDHVQLNRRSEHQSGLEPIKFDFLPLPL